MRIRLSDWMQFHCDGCNNVMSNYGKGVIGCRIPDCPEYGKKYHLPTFDLEPVAPRPVVPTCGECEHFKVPVLPHPESLCVTCTLAREYGHYCKGRFTATLYPVSDRVNGGVAECKFYAAESEPKSETLCETCVRRSEGLWWCRKHPGEKNCNQYIAQPESLCDSCALQFCLRRDGVADRTPSPKRPGEKCMGYKSPEGPHSICLSCGNWKSWNGWDPSHRYCHPKDRKVPLAIGWDCDLVKEP